jgi:hypothetical protein
MHGAAHWLALRALLSGGCVIVNSVVDHLEPADVWRTIETHRADTTLFIGEAFARPLLDELQAAFYDISSLRLIAVGGAFTSPATKQRMLGLIPQAVVVDLAGALRDRQRPAPDINRGTPDTRPRLQTRPRRHRPRPRACPPARPRRRRDRLAGQVAGIDDGDAPGPCEEAHQGRPHPVPHPR